MNWTEDFSEALEEFKLSGGAMAYSDNGTGTPAWLVAAGETIAEMSTCSAKEATRHALEMGGCTLAEIAELLDGWVE